MIKQDITAIVYSPDNEPHDDINRPLELAGVRVELGAWAELRDGVPPSVSASTHVIVADVSGLADVQYQQIVEISNGPALLGTPLIFLTDEVNERNLRESEIRFGGYKLCKPIKDNDLVAIVSAASAVHLRAEKLREEVRQRTSAIGQIVTGEFKIQSLEEALNLSTMLSLACPDPAMVAVGILELMVNAVEHGNLGIGYDLKSELLKTNTWKEEIDRRLTLPENVGKFVTVCFAKSESAIRIDVTDEGAGFDFAHYLKNDYKRKTGETHGRGIFLAQRSCFDRLEYRDGGTGVIASIEIAI